MHRCLYKTFEKPYGFTMSQVQSYERLLPLVPLNYPVKSVSDIKRGDCVVTFSRRQIYQFKVGDVSKLLVFHYSFISLFDR